MPAGALGSRPRRARQPRSKASRRVHTTVQPTSRTAMPGREGNKAQSESELKGHGKPLLLGVPKLLKPGMPTMRWSLEKSFTLGLIVRALTSLRPLGYERAPDWSLEMVGKAVSNGLPAARLTLSTQSEKTAPRVVTRVRACVAALAGRRGGRSAGPTVTTHRRRTRGWTGRVACRFPSIL